jgi:FkbM family methyltransferase
MSKLTGSSALRKTLKSAYLRVPYKRQLFSAVRKVWVPPKRLYHYLYFDDRFEIEVLDRRFLMNNHALDVETDIFWTGLLGSWEKRSLAVWIELCQRSTVILDVGANTGVYALVAQTVNPRASVYGFEPVKRVFDRFTANVALNRYAIQCQEVALSNYDGRAVIYDIPVDHIYCVAVNKNLHPNWEATPIDIATKRLSTLIEEERLPTIDLIKLDVESHEPEVVEGMGPYLARMRPTFIVEVWNDDVGRRLEDRFRGLDYRYFRTDEVSAFTPETRISNPHPERGYVSYLICSDEVARWLSTRAGTFPPA